MLQHLQGGGAGRLGGLAVVGVALPVALPQAVGVHIVPGRAVLGPHLLQKGHRLFLAVRKGELRDEAALLFLVFAQGRTPDGAVIFHSASYRTPPVSHPLDSPLTEGAFCSLRSGPSLPL